MVINMNKKGITLIEVLISISLVAIVSLLLIKVIFSLNSINNNANYASVDEISRAQIIKIIEQDFLNLKLEGITITRKENSTIIVFKYENESKELIVEKNSITYNFERHPLNTKNATYSLNIDYQKTPLDEHYYLININIPVLINEENTSNIDDLNLTYIGLNKNYQNSAN